MANPKNKRTVKKESTSVDVEILDIEMPEVKFTVLGSTSFIFNRLSDKARRELLLPKGKTRSNRNEPKHTPVQEYRDSPYKRKGKGPTALYVPGAMFKQAMVRIGGDATDVPMTKLRCWMHVIEERVSFYGVPELHMDVVRQAGMNRTPDIRTRAIVPEWCCTFTVRYCKPFLSEKKIVKLLAGAGQIVGVGDKRAEKGAGIHGLFQLVGPKDKRVQRIMKAGARAAQVKALESPALHDEETEDLMSWYGAEVRRRDMKVA